MGPYDLGAAVPTADIALTLTDDTGTPADPAVLPVLTLTLPDQSTATPAVVKSAVGSYKLAAPYVTTQAGHHLWAWTWTGAFLASSETVDSFEVRAAPDPTIIALAEAKEILKLTATTEFDEEIRGFSQAVTEWIEYVIGPVVTRQVTEVVRSGGNVLVLGNPPIRTDLGTTLNTANRRDGSTTNGLVSITPLLTYGFMYAIDDLLVDGPSGLVRHVAGLPFFYGGDPYPQYSATYWVGRAVCPWGAYEAAKITLKHIWAVERGGVAQGAAFGEEVVTVPGISYLVPARAVQMLTPHGGKASRAAFA